MKNESIALIKGLACMAVFWGHFWDCFYWYNDIDKSSASIAGKITGIPFYFFICGGFMVWIFCILSGYLSYHKEIEKISSLIIAIMKRYIRFLIPVLISNLVIFLGAIFNIFPVDSSNMSNIVLPIEIIIKSLKLESLNGALWMISQLFVGNCIIYIYSFLDKMIKNKYISILGFWGVYLSLAFNLIIFATLTGVILEVLLNKVVVKINKKICLLVIISSIIWTGGGKSLCTKIYAFARTSVAFPSRWLFSCYCGSDFMCNINLCIRKSKETLEQCYN